MPYVELQKLLDKANARGFYCREKSTNIENLSDVVIEHVPPRKNSPMSKLLLYRLDGAYSGVGDDETAFSGGRSPGPQAERRLASRARGRCPLRLVRVQGIASRPLACCRLALRWLWPRRVTSRNCRSACAGPANGTVMARRPCRCYGHGQLWARLTSTTM
jgi:hypothetical protein